jgi:REP element-mobilizing transposase RayT
VICRGNQRKVIFLRDADREYYLERLEEYRQRYGFKVYAYVLMSNHVHLLMETGAIPLSKIMQGIQFSYTTVLTILPNVLARLLNETFPHSKSFRQALGSLSPSFLACQFGLENTYGTVFA